MQLDKKTTQQANNATEYDPTDTLMSLSALGAMMR